jgi:hypothetical protein
MHYKYDLKGSTYGRTSRKGKYGNNSNIVLKDLDFIDDNMKMVVDQKMKDTLLE